MREAAQFTKSAILLAFRPNRKLCACMKAFAYFSCDSMGTGSVEILYDVVSSKTPGLGRETQRVSVRSPF